MDAVTSVEDKRIEINYGNVRASNTEEYWELIRGACHERVETCDRPHV